MPAFFSFSLIYYLPLTSPYLLLSKEWESMGIYYNQKKQHTTPSFIRRGTGGGKMEKSLL
jgi:hypothetical protein